MAMDIECPECGETDHLSGERGDGVVVVTCGSCGRRWERDLTPRCPTCEGTDLRPAVKAIVEKGRGTQLSVVGTEVVHLCRRCDAATIERYEANRPNPLMPDQLPTVGPEQAG